MWDARITKIMLGGWTDTRHLQDMSTLIGERDETTDAVTIGERGLRSNRRTRISCGAHTALLRSTGGWGGVPYESTANAKRGGARL